MSQVKDWAVINRYEENYNNQLNAIDAMERDLNNGLLKGGRR